MIVVDSSTLILLAKTELLDKFIAFFDKCIISETVFFESTKRKNSFDSSLIEKRVNDGKLAVSKIKNEKAVIEIIQSFGLERGESECLVLGIEFKTEFIGVDDGKAIKVAKILEIRFITALTFVIILFKNKKIDRENAVEFIRKLALIGRYDKGIVEFAIKEVEKNE